MAIIHLPLAHLPRSNMAHLPRKWHICPVFFWHICSKNGTFAPVKRGTFAQKKTKPLCIFVFNLIFYNLYCINFFMKHSKIVYIVATNTIWFKFSCCAFQFFCFLQFCHNFFLVISQFEWLSLVTIWDFKLCHHSEFWVLSSMD